MTKIRILCATLYTLLAVGANPLTANTLNVDNLLNMRSGDMRLVAIHTEPKAMVNTTFSDENSIVVYPNPASNFALINLPKNIESFKIEITDLLGKIIFSEEVKTKVNEYKIDLEGYNDGIYFVKVTNEKMKKSFKIIVKK